MSDWAGIAWLFALLAINAFFVAAEFAVLAARRSQIEASADEGSVWARNALWAMEHATEMLATCQLGITVCSLLILNVSEPAIHHLLEIPLELTGLPEGVIGTVAFIITLVVVSFLHVVLGEMVPKNISFSLPDGAVKILATPLVAISTVLRPLVWALNKVANGTLRLFGVTPKNEATSAFTYDEVATIVATSRSAGQLKRVVGETLTNAFEFTEKTVGDVAVPTAELVTITSDATPADVERAVTHRGFSRYIVVDASGEPTGYVHLKDVIGRFDDAYDTPLPRKLIRSLDVQYEETPLENALADLRKRATAEEREQGHGNRRVAHVARVRDSQGRTTGVIFLEDIIEVLVGEVLDATRRQ